MKIIAQKTATGVSITYPLGKSIEALVAELEDAVIIEASELPSDRTFRNAWKLEEEVWSYHKHKDHAQKTMPWVLEWGSGWKVVVDLGKAKEMCHTQRRIVRAEEFAPWDIKVTIRDESAAAEAQRQKIRTKHAAIQTQIDGAATTEVLEGIYKTLIVPSTM